jgi:hypothetical protein
MGYATITDGGKDGRYTIRLDFGEARRLQIVDALREKLTKIDATIADVQVLVTAGEAKEAQQIASINSYIDALEATMATLPPGSPFPDADGYTVLLRDLRQIQRANAPNRLAMAALKALKAQTQKELGAFETLQTIETRQAWCADFTEDAAGQVATLDIPGESSLLLVAPAGRVYIPQIDGVLTARELMSPAQVFFNAAILPGWQIDRPTYRWGTLTFIDWDGNTGNVTLGEALSSAQRLPVNASATLSGVVFDYMQTNCRAFNDDSRVVLDLRQGWDAPRIIGFLDNPRPDPPTLVAGSGFDRTFSQDVAGSYDYSAYWTGGKDPRTYTLRTGTLPAGLSLNSSTGVLSGTPTTQTTATGLVIRCSDTFYDEAKNRRYDDSPAFQVLVYGGWSFADVTLDEIAITELSQPGTVIRARAESVYNPADYDARAEKYVFVGSGTTEVIDFGTWFIDADTAGSPSIWHKVSYTGDPPDAGPTPGVWTAGRTVIVDWILEGDIDPAGSDRIASYTIQFATDSIGSNIEATVTGSVNLLFT